MNVYADKGIENENIEIVYDAIVRPTDDMSKHLRLVKE